jgi:hypothetical protein
VLLAVAMLAGACSTTTSFVVENAPAGTVLDVGNAPAVAVTSPSAIPIEVSTGAEPVQWKLRNTHGVVVDEGTIERTEVQWPIVATGLGLAACCMPGGAAVGFCLANPALLAAPISCLAAGNAGVVITTLASPSWATGPLTAAGFAVGATPVLLGLAAQAPPAQVTITLPASVVVPVPMPTAPPSTPPAVAAPTSPEVERPIGEPNRMPF